jgi:tRNA threonylcarbamoyladenosine biosynthesis protein TsaE
MLVASESEMVQLGAHLAALLRPGDAVLLEGPLGAGKTVLARSVIRALAGQGEAVPSPTFTLVQTYEVPGAVLWHFDLYRLDDPEEIWELGWEEALAGGIALVEWPQRLGRYRPASALAIRIEPAPGGARRVSAEGGRLAGLWP